MGKIRWDIGAIIAAIGIFSAGLIYIVTLHNDVEDLKDDMASAVEIERLSKKISDLEGDEAIKKRVFKALSQINARIIKFQEDPLVGGNLPIGSIIPIYFDLTESQIYNLIPKSWVLCDGKRINSDHPQKFIQKDVHKRFWNTESPRLHDRFIKGWKSQDDLLNTGGSNTNVHMHNGTSNGTGQHGPSQGARMGANNNVTLPERQHQHSFITGNNSDKSELYSNTPEYISMYYIMKIK